MCTFQHEGRTVDDPTLDELVRKAPFGTCPWCGAVLGWSSDEPWCEDETVTIRNCVCPNCGASIEAMECPKEDRKDYPYHNMNNEQGRVSEEEG